MHTVRIALVCAAALTLAQPALAASPPAVTKIALTRADLPSDASIPPKSKDYVSPRSLNGDTVPQGLSIQHLKRAGFRGMLTEGLARSHDSNPYGYPWIYIALRNAAAAHTIYADWVKSLKKPFNFPVGKSAVADECRFYRSVLPGIYGLLCRLGLFVVFGHYTDKPAVERLMIPVIARARHLRG